MTTILLTGTPGVGKTSVAKRFSSIYNYKYINLNEFSKKYIIKYDSERETYIVDLDKVKDELRKITENNNYIIESHISHFMDGDFVIVLRLDPKILMERLKIRGYKKKKIVENIEAEILDVCLVESIEVHGLNKVYEIDVTNKTIQEICEDIFRIISDKNYRKKFKPGNVRWLEKYYNLMSNLRKNI